MIILIIVGCIILALFIYVFVIEWIRRVPVAPLGEELEPEGEQKIIDDISKLLTDHLREQYKDNEFLRNSHPKENGCVKAKFIVDQDIDSEYQHGVFQPGAQYNAWIRFSNSAGELTEDSEKDFRGLGLKLTNINVEGERVAIPGDEKNTQDFLFLGNDAFFAADPKQFFDFNDANFKGQTTRFLLTHLRGAWNLITGSKRYITPLDLNWNSVTSYALGQLKSDKKYTYIVRYAMQTCSANIGEIPDPPTPDYLAQNLGKQLAMDSEGGMNACFNFYIQKQVNAKNMPVENALIKWDQGKSPFIKIAEVHLPQQSFTSEGQKQFCENISFNPGHSLVMHKPLGGINRTRLQVMKAISDLRLEQNNMKRIEATGNETFE